MSDAAENDAPLVRTTYAVTVEHKSGDEPILAVSEGARIVGVHYFATRVTPPGNGGDA